GQRNLQEASTVELRSRGRCPYTTFRAITAGPNSNVWCGASPRFRKSSAPTATAKMCAGLSVCPPRRSPRRNQSRPHAGLAHMRSAWLPANGIATTRRRSRSTSYALLSLKLFHLSVLVLSDEHRLGQLLDRSSFDTLAAVVR